MLFAIPFVFTLAPSALGAQSRPGSRGTEGQAEGASRLVPHEGTRLRIWPRGARDGALTGRLLGADSMRLTLRVDDGPDYTTAWEALDSVHVQRGRARDRRALRGAAGAGALAGGALGAGLALAVAEGGSEEIPIAPATLGAAAVGAGIGALAGGLVATIRGVERWERLDGLPRR